MTSRDNILNTISLAHELTTFVKIQQDHEGGEWCVSIERMSSYYLVTVID